MTDLMPGTVVLGFTPEPHVILAATPKGDRPARVLALSLNPETAHRYVVWDAYTRDGGESWEVERGDYLYGGGIDLAVATYASLGGEPTLDGLGQIVEAALFPPVVAR